LIPTVAFLRHIIKSYTYLIKRYLNNFFIYFNNYKMLEL
jgi:hypothetical protein